MTLIYLLYSVVTVQPKNNGSYESITPALTVNNSGVDCIL